MLNKKYLILFLLIVFVCIPHVNATDDLDNLTQTDSVDMIESDYLDEDIQTTENREYGTFTELDELVQVEYYIDLQKDYLCDDEKDGGWYTDGIEIKHELTLNGNGHTINGNMSRIFKIYKADEVRIYNLTFTNSYYPGITGYYSAGVRDFAGAIHSCGGMLYLENCTFINNHANYDGGAILNGPNTNLIINNCTFLNNSIARINGAYGGGAIKSYGRLKVLNSTFCDNFAKFGGAIAAFNETDIRDSYFENNEASISGGAVFNYFPNVCEIYNSSFYGNVAQQGGALFATTAINCNFLANNYASSKGNISYYGTIINCTCLTQDSDDFYGTVNSTGLSFEPKNLIFEKGGYNKVLEFTIISNPTHESVDGVILNIDIVDKNGKVTNYQLVSDEFGKVNISLSDFANGSYRVSVSFLNKLYNESVVNYTLALGITYSKVSFSAGVVFEYGGSGSIYVTVDGGYVELKNIQVIGHPEAKITLANKLITISGLGVGKYTLRVQTTPDESHFATVGTVGINVKKAIAVIKASKLTVALKKGTLWTIKLVNSKNNKPIANMKLKLKVYTGKKYKTVTVSTNSKGEARYKTSALTKGTHKVVVSGTHLGYSFNTVTSSIKVIKPKALKFKLQKRTNDKNGALLSYVVMDKKTKKGVNGVKVNLLIYTGKKVKTVTLKTKKVGKYKGAMGFATNELSVGKHKVVIVPASIKYSGSAKTSMIIKKAAKKRQLYSHKL